MIIPAPAPVTATLFRTVRRIVEAQRDLLCVAPPARLPPDQSPRNQLIHLEIGGAFPSLIRDN
jgi:hypothetical protein